MKRACECREDRGRSRNVFESERGRLLIATEFPFKRYFASLLSEALGVASLSLHATFLSPSGYSAMIRISQSPLNGPIINRSAFLRAATRVNCRELWFSSDGATDFTDYPTKATGSAIPGGSGVSREYDGSITEVACPGNTTGISPEAGSNSILPRRDRLTNHRQTWAFLLRSRNTFALWMYSEFFSFPFFFFFFRDFWLECRVSSRDRFSCIKIGEEGREWFSLPSSLISLHDDVRCVMFYWNYDFDDISPNCPLS